MLSKDLFPITTFMNDTKIEKGQIWGCVKFGNNRKITFCLDTSNDFCLKLNAVKASSWVWTSDLQSKKQSLSIRNYPVEFHEHLIQFRPSDALHLSDTSCLSHSKCSEIILIPRVVKQLPHRWVCPPLGWDWRGGKSPRSIPTGLGRSIAGFSLRKPGFTPGSVRVGFVVDKVVLGQVSIRVLRFCTVSIIPPCLSTLVYHLGGRTRGPLVAAVQRRSLTININVRDLSKAVPLHSMEALGGIGGIAPTHSRPRH
jgi:hypothetical protein